MARSLRFSRSSLSWALTVPLGCIAVLAIYLAAQHRGPVVSRWPLIVLFIGLFAVADSSNLHVEMRRHGARMTVGEIPLLLALFYLSPITLLVIRVVVYAASLILRHSAPVKVAFNVASIACATAVAALIVDAHRPLVALEPRTWLILVGSVLVGLLLTSANTFGVIWLVQGPMKVSDLFDAALPGNAIGAVNAVIGLVVLIVVQTRWAFIPLAVVAASLALVYRSYAQFMRQHRRLTDIYDVTRAISETSYDGTLADVLLKRIGALLRAEYATLWLPSAGRYPETMLSARADDKGLLDLSATPSEMRRLAIERNMTIAAGRKLGDEDMRRELRAANTKDAIVVPLRSGGAVIGSLEVAGRMHDSETFTPDDVRLMETLAAHASVAVENNRLVDRLRFDAYHDALTGLPNRRRMLGALEEALKIRVPNEVVAVMIFDSDGLRDVNDSIGHAAGDKLLLEFATRLRTVCPPAGLVGRVGGDGFAVTIRIESADAAIALAGELRDALSHPMEIGPLTLDVGAAVGIAVHPDHGSEPATLLQRATVATHAAKSRSSAIQLFDPSLESKSVRRLGLATDLRRALDHDGLEVYFQPKVNLRTRDLVGVECLARWEHPVHGAVAPEDFVAVAEHTGQLGRLTEFVLRQGLQRAHEWDLAGHPLPISVNLSPRTVVDQDFPARVASLLEEFGVEPDRLTLEITEDGMITDRDRSVPTLRVLDSLGVRISVDDFGTGYSSLSYLRRLPVDEVKIDRSFVQGMATDPGDLAIVRAIVELTRSLGLSVVAEGVESELTLSMLDEMGCDIGQGFLFSRPLPYDRLEAWIAARTDTVTASVSGIRRLRAVQ